MLNIVLCGAGYWGRNLLRVLQQNPGFHVRCVADRSEEAREAARRIAPGIRVVADAEAAIDEPGIDAVMIATPVATHHRLGQLALDRARHVMIEKPLCASAAEASDLVSRARLGGRTLMVDHTFLFHPAVRHLGAMLDRGDLGRVSYYDSQRINLGIFQPDVNVLWDLAPHDLAILDTLFGEEAVHVEASGYCHVNPALPDLAFITLHYPSGRVAHLNLSWMSPVKQRRIAVGGSARMAVWDDLNRDEPLKIYESGITVLPQNRREVIVPGYRVGDVSSPRLANREPLADAVEHFRRVILGEEACLSPGEQGLRIVRTLERAQSALDRSLGEVARRQQRETPAYAVAAE